MSPASYLTAPPRVAGGSLPTFFHQLEAALEHAARVRHLCEHAVKLLALLWIEPCEEPLLNRFRGLLGGRQASPAFLRELDDVPPAVLRVAAADDRAIRLEVIEQADELAGVDADRVDQRLLARRMRVNLVEHAHVARRQAGRLERLSEPALCRAADLHQQHPGARRVAQRVPAFLCLGRLSRCHAETLANNQYLTSGDHFL